MNLYFPRTQGMYHLACSMGLMVSHLDTSTCDETIDFHEDEQTSFPHKVVLLESAACILTFLALTILCCINHPKKDAPSFRRPKAPAGSRKSSNNSSPPHSRKSDTSTLFPNPYYHSTRSNGQSNSGGKINVTLIERGTGDYALLPVDKNSEPGQYSLMPDPPVHYSVKSMDISDGGSQRDADSSTSLPALPENSENE